MERKPRSERLERMLRTIQDIKEQNYGLIGTQDVWDFLKQQRGVYEVPDKIAARINEEVRKAIPTLTYEATPERLDGIYTEFVCLNTMVGGDTYFELIGRHGAKCFADIGGLTIVEDSEKEQIKAANFFRPFFLEANKDRITDDGEIGAIIAYTLKEDYNSVRKRIPEISRDECDDYVQKLCIEMAVRDWRENLSKQTFIREQTFSVRLASENAFNLNKMTERIRRERVEHKLEYRRGILGHVLSDSSRDIASSFGFPMESWKGFIRSYEDRIRRVKKELSGKEIVEEERRIYQSALNTFTFIHRLLRQEKNWVEKVLKS